MGRLITATLVWAYLYENVTHNTPVVLTSRSRLVSLQYLSILIAYNSFPSRYFFKDLDDKNRLFINIKQKQNIENLLTVCTPAHPENE